MLKIVIWFIIVLLGCCKPSTDWKTRKYYSNYEYIKSLMGDDASSGQSENPPLVVNTKNKKDGCPCNNLPLDEDLKKEPAESAKGNRRCGCCCGDCCGCCNGAGGGDCSCHGDGDDCCGNDCCHGGYGSYGYGYGCGTHDGLPAFNCWCCQNNISKAAKAAKAAAKESAHKTNAKNNDDAAKEPAAAPKAVEKAATKDAEANPAKEDVADSAKGKAVDAGQEMAERLKATPADVSALASDDNKPDIANNSNTSWDKNMKRINTTISKIKAQTLSAMYKRCNCCPKRSSIIKGNPAEVTNDNSTKNAAKKQCCCCCPCCCHCCHHHCCHHHCCHHHCHHHHRCHRHHHCGGCHTCCHHHYNHPCCCCCGSNGGTHVI